MVVLAAARLGLAIALAVLSWRGLGSAALTVGAAALVADAAQRVAIWRGMAGGERLARWAEVALWVALPAAGAWFRPEVIEAWPRSSAIIAVAVTLPLAFGFIKYGALVRHGARTGGPALYLMAGVVALVLRAGPGWPVALGALAAVASALEDVAITALLPQEVGRVASVAAARRLRRERLSDPDRRDDLL